MTLSDTDLAHLRHCIELAREALDDGDEPFGSVLVSATGETLFADRNRVVHGDETRHPEFEISRWAATHLAPADRAAATVYTSGEVVPGAIVDGPAPELEAEIKDLHRHRFA